MTIGAPSGVGMAALKGREHTGLAVRLQRVDICHWTRVIEECFNRCRTELVRRIATMGINMTVSADGSRVTIAVSGKFDFQLYDDFRSCYSATAGEGVAYIVDLSETEYLDSSALGMLLLLREHAGGEGSDIEITEASAEVRKILDVANFGKLFRF